MKPQTLAVLLGITYLALAIIDIVTRDGTDVHLLISSNVFLAASFVMHHQNNIQRANIRYGD